MFEQKVTLNCILLCDGYKYGRKWRIMDALRHIYLTKYVSNRCLIVPCMQFFINLRFANQFKTSRVL